MTRRTSSTSRTGSSCGGTRAESTSNTFNNKYVRGSTTTRRNSSTTTHGRHFDGCRSFGGVRGACVTSARTGASARSASSRSDTCTRANDAAPRTRFGCVSCHRCSGQSRTSRSCSYNSQSSTKAARSNTGGTHGTSTRRRRRASSQGVSRSTASVRRRGCSSHRSCSLVSDAGHTCG